MNYSTTLDDESQDSSIAEALPRRTASIAVVVPCYRVANQLLNVLEQIGPEVSQIYCVDDGCADGSGQVAASAALRDSRIVVLRHEQNSGVGAAVVTGYRRAMDDGAEIIVKLDGDGQMAPDDIWPLIQPILRGEADYVKGNRFFRLSDLRSMPRIRLIGNAGLSFLSKLSSGYWNLFDPTNGFTAIHVEVARLLVSEKISPRYFFESDVLFRLNTLRAVVIDVPLQSRYAEEKSNLSITKSLLEFPFFHLRSFAKRIFYCYFLRDFNVASLNLILGLALLAFGFTFGVSQWVRGYRTELLASPGTVMLAALPIILGWQALLSFILFDMSNIPKYPLQRSLKKQSREKIA